MGPLGGEEVMRADPSWWDYCPHKGEPAETLESPLGPFSTWGHREKAAVNKPKGEASVGT